MKIYILAKIIVENYYNRYYTPMLDTGAEANMCKHNCLPDEKWEKLKTGFSIFILFILFFAVILCFVVSTYRFLQRAVNILLPGANSIPDIFQYNTNDLSIFLSFIATE